MNNITKACLVCIFVFSVLLLIITFNACSNARQSVLPQAEYTRTKRNPRYDLMFPAEPNANYTIKTDVDLNGKTYLMPEGVTLVQKNGIIKNGTIVGNGTMIKATNKAIFDNVNIKGQWNVRSIPSSLFKDLTHTNALRNVLALTNPEIYNDVVISEGHYIFELEKEGDNGISICSNTKLTMNGVIEIVPNNFKSYRIISIKGDRVKVQGTGTIIGDKINHIGSDGEWGMGVYISNSTDCEVGGLTVKDCWGDCVYVGKGSKDIVLSNLTLVNGRRQGISITDGENIKVSNTKISDVAGTAPGYAIDVEPNRQNHIRNVTIDNVDAINCDGGVVVSVIHPDESSVDGVFLNKCRVSNVQKMYSLALNKCKNVLVKESYLGSNPNKYCCAVSKVDGIKLVNNVIYSQEFVINDISGVSLTGNEVFGNELYPANIKTYLTPKKKINNNNIHKLK